MWSFTSRFLAGVLCFRLSARQCLQALGWSMATAEGLVLMADGLVRDVQPLFLTGARMRGWKLGCPELCFALSQRLPGFCCALGLILSELKCSQRDCTAQLTVLGLPKGFSLLLGVEGRLESSVCCQWWCRRAQQWQGSVGSGQQKRHAGYSAGPAFVFTHCDVIWL